MGKRRVAVLVCVLVLGFGALTAPVSAETRTLAASCAVDIFTDGVAAPRFSVAGSFQLTGSAPASVHVDEPIVFTGVQLRLALDWEVLRPELESRGVTELSGWLLRSWFSRVQDGVDDWPVPIEGDFTTFPVERFGSGIATVAQDRELLPAVEPGAIEWANYGDVYVAFRKYDSPQVAVHVHCVPDAGQDHRYGTTTVLP